MSSLTVSKKRKVSEENRTFQSKWTEEYFFIYLRNNAICMVCSEKNAVLKEYNLKRHYETNHASKFSHLKGQFRKDKAKELQICLSKQQSVFKAATSKSITAVHASYVVSEILAKKMKPFVDGEIIKECLEAVADIAFSDKKDIISKISLSRFTIARRIDDLADDIQQSLISSISDLQWISLSLDESTDMCNTAQLAVFVRGTDLKFNIIEELAYLMPMRGTNTGEDVYAELKKVISRLNISIEKIVGISTDGAPAMAGRNLGLCGLIAKDIKKASENELIVSHCLIHQENLCAKVLKMSNVVPQIIKLINFIRSRGLNHRQFKEFLRDLESEYGDVLFYTEVRWLSRGKMLRRVYELKSEIQLFLEMKEYPFPEFNNQEWMCDFAFCVDITYHLNELNTSLQGKNNLIHELFEKIKIFESKLQIWNRQLQNNNMFNFSTLKKENPACTDKYAKEIQCLQEEFKLRFQDFRKHENSFKLFSSPFDITPESTQDEYQMELIELQGNIDLKYKFRDVSLMDFYKQYFPIEKFPILADHARKMISLFGSTYLCEQLFSKMKIIKNSARNRLADERLESCLRVAVSNTPANINKLIDKKDCQISH